MNCVIKLSVKLNKTLEERMIISNVFTGKFLKRPNRFTIKFESGNTQDFAHLRDPGRLKELLIPVLIFYSGLLLMVKTVKHSLIYYRFTIKNDGC